MYPHARDEKEELVTVNGTTFCSNTSSASSQLRNVIPRANMVIVIVQHCRDDKNMAPMRVPYTPISVDGFR